METLCLYIRHKAYICIKEAVMAANNKTVQNNNRSSNRSNGANNARKSNSGKTTTSRSNSGKNTANNQYTKERKAAARAALPAIFCAISAKFTAA